MLLNSIIAPSAKNTIINMNLSLSPVNTTTAVVKMEEVALTYKDWATSERTTLLLKANWLITYLIVAKLNLFYIPLNKWVIVWVCECVRVCVIHKKILSSFLNCLNLRKALFSIKLLLVCTVSSVSKTFSLIFHFSYTDFKNIMIVMIIIIMMRLFGKYIA